MAIIKVSEKLDKETFEENLTIVHGKSYRYKMAYPHFHDGHEINLTLTDGTIYNVEEKSYVAKSGAICVFSENEIHRTIAPNDSLYERYFVYFKPQFIQELSISFNELIAPFENRAPGFENCILLESHQKDSMLNMLSKMLACYKDKNRYAHELRSKLILCELLLYVSELFAVNSNTLPIKNYAYREQIKLIMDYIKNNPSEDLCLDALASKFYISKTNLMISFKKAIGMTPNQYITYCRIMKSREYLKMGLPVYKTCELVGYQDESSFIRAFGKLIGVTPKQYAKK